MDYEKGRATSLVFSIISGNRDSAFEINAFGKVETAQELDAEIETIYQLKIIVAANLFNTEKTTLIDDIMLAGIAHPQTLLEVRVLNLNDNSPFIPFLPTIQLKEGWNFLKKNFFYKR